MVSEIEHRTKPVAALASRHETRPVSGAGSSEPGRLLANFEFKARITMKLCAVALILCLAAVSSVADDSDRKHIVLKATAELKLPFSDAVLVGNTLYVAGHLGLDPSTGKPPAAGQEEAKRALDAIKEVVENAGMSMDDVVSVQVYCSDLTLYDTFNTVYRTYFHDPYPARAFLGTGPLLRGARFEIMAIAVKPSK
jgi:2-iminobutanoate/2-iminopropanoate deaminase